MICLSALPSAFSSSFCSYLSGSRLKVDFSLEIVLGAQVLAKEVWRLVMLRRSLKDSLWGQAGQEMGVSLLFYTTRSCVTDLLTQPRA